MRHDDTNLTEGRGGCRECDRLDKLYHELLYAVATKHPGETRHQTALRYIRQTETPSLNCASSREDSGE